MKEVDFDLAAGAAERQDPDDMRAAAAVLERRWSALHTMGAVATWVGARQGRPCIILVIDADALAPQTIPDCLEGFEVYYLRAKKVPS
jgi:hypothetical protein